MSLVYNIFKTLEADGTIDLTTDSFVVALVGSTYSEDADHQYFNSSVYQTELSGTGYEAGYGGSGRQTLTDITVAEDDTNDWALVSCSPLTWSAINAGTAAAAVVMRYRAATGDTMSELVCFIDSGGFPVTTNGGDLTITFSNGILKLA